MSEERLRELHEQLREAKRFGAAESVLDALLAQCPDVECERCAEVICPDGDTLHFHHDGCPSCAEKEPPT